MRAPNMVSQPHSLPGMNENERHTLISPHFLAHPGGSWQGLFSTGQGSALE